MQITYILQPSKAMFVSVKLLCWFTHDLSKSFCKFSLLGSAIYLLSAAIPRFITTSSTTFYLLMSALKITRKFWYKLG